VFTGGVVGEGVDNGGTRVLGATATVLEAVWPVGRSVAWVVDSFRLAGEKRELPQQVARRDRFPRDVLGDREAHDAAGSGDVLQEPDDVLRLWGAFIGSAGWRLNMSAPQAQGAGRPRPGDLHAVRRRAACRA